LRESLPSAQPKVPYCADDAPIGKGHSASKLLAEMPPLRGQRTAGNLYRQTR